MDTALFLPQYVETTLYGYGIIHLTLGFSHFDISSPNLNVIEYIRNGIKVLLNRKIHARSIHSNCGNIYSGTLLCALPKSIYTHVQN